MTLRCGQAGSLSLSASVLADFEAVTNDDGQIIGYVVDPDDLTELIAAASEIDRLTRALTAARAEAMEEAARGCDAEADRYDSLHEESGEAMHSEFASFARSLGWGIRALAKAQP